MKWLILGGTVFLGRHLVDAALAAGDDVTIFHRGRRPLDAHPEVERLVGDRDADLSALQGRRFDAVIDCSGYTPTQVSASARALRGTGAAYVFVSTISVLASFPPGRPYDEDAPVTTATEGYGGGKARAEEVLRREWDGPLAVVRPGLIVGPHDPTGRFTYWPLRIALGGEVLAPGRPERPVQFIDVRDVAAFCLAQARARASGLWQVIGPQGPMATLLDTCREVGASDARFTWVGDEALLRAQAVPWTGLPLWLPEADREVGGLLFGRNDRAVAAGLRCRHWKDTVAATLTWAREAGRQPGDGAGLRPQQEAALLQAVRDA